MGEANHNEHVPYDAGLIWLHESDNLRGLKTVVGQEGLGLDEYAIDEVLMEETSATFCDALHGRSEGICLMVSLRFGHFCGQVKSLLFVSLFTSMIKYSPGFSGNPADVRSKPDPPDYTRVFDVPYQNVGTDGRVCRFYQRSLKNTQRETI